MSSKPVNSDALAEVPGAAARPASALFATLARLLTDEIEAGRYKVGQKIPTEAELQQRFDVSRHTVREALRDLKSQGLVTARAGIGTVVRAKGAPHALHAGHRHAEGADPVRRGHAHEGAQAPRASSPTRSSPSSSA